MTDAAIQYFANLLLLSCLALPLFYLCKTEAARRRVLILLGFWMIYTVAPRLLLFWPAYWLLVWAYCRCVERTKDERSLSNLLFIGILGALAPMLLWKLYPDMFIFELNSVLHKSLSAIAPLLRPLDQNAPWVVPVGLSFATFRAIDLMVNIRLELVEPPRLRDVFHYGLFAPVLMVGPIIQYQELNTGKHDATAKYENILRGMLRIILGFAKLFFLALPLAGSQAIVTGFADHSDLTQGVLLVQTIIFAWYLYLNFSAYSDIAIGIGRLYGYSLRENFNFPYFRATPQLFWANWHMSLTSFAQRNVFIPLGGYRKNKQYIATVCTMMVIALWHGLTLSMVLFGVLHATALIALRYRDARYGAPENVSVPRKAAGIFLTFSFVAGTIPLLLLDFSEVPAFYGMLLLGMSL